MTAGTTGAEWAAATVRAGPSAWQRTAAAIRAWIAAGELPVHPAMLPPCQCPAAELDEECCTVARALAEFGDAYAFDGLGSTRDAKFRAIRYDYSTGLKTARSVAGLRAKVLDDLDCRSAL